MSDILKEKVEAVDAFITSLGMDGKNFVEQLKKVGTTVGVADKNAEFSAYYDSKRNVIHVPEDISFFELFNYYVHEGTHAIQTHLTPQVTKAINNTCQKNTDGVIISLTDLLKYKRIAEMNAHSIQSYFNALAIEQSGNTAYIDFMLSDDSLKDFAKLQKTFLEQGLSAQEIKDKMALAYPSIPNTQISNMVEQSLSYQEAYDFITLLSYAKFNQESPNSRVVTFTEEDMSLVLNAVSPLSSDVSAQIQAKASKPLELACINKSVVEEFGLEL